MSRDRKHKFPESLNIKLFGSRARGDNKPDSDWDIVIISPLVNDLTCPETFCKKYREIARKYFSIPLNDKIDLFCAHPNWKLALHEEAYWHEGQACWIGWGDYIRNEKRQKT